tara:strand:+ start:485 stop:1633 length:1149 start_codon:yes stop_codon:yes gene_type:complete
MPTGIGMGIAGEVFQNFRVSAAPVADCPTSNSLEFDGISDYGLITGALGIGALDFSISFWIKVPDITGGGVGMSIWESGFGVTAPLKIEFDASGVLTASSTDATVTDLIFPNITTIPNDTWTHIALTADRSGDWKWYINAVNTTTTDFSAITRSFPASALSYFLAQSSGVYFEGLATEFSIWDDALLPSEVRAIYTNMSGAQDCLNALPFDNNHIQNGNFAATPSDLYWVSAVSGANVITFGPTSVRMESPTGTGTCNFRQNGVLEIGASTTVTYTVTVAPPIGTSMTLSFSGGSSLNTTLGTHTMTFTATLADLLFTSIGSVDMSITDIICTQVSTANVVTWYSMTGDAGWNTISYNILDASNYITWQNMDASNLSTDVPT